MDFQSTHKLSQEGTVNNQSPPSVIKRAANSLRKFGFSNTLYF